MKNQMQRSGQSKQHTKRVQKSKPYAAVRSMYGDDCFNKLPDPVLDAVGDAFTILGALHNFDFQSTQVAICAVVLHQSGWESGERVKNALKKMAESQDLRDRIRFTRCLTPSDFLEHGPKRTGLDRIPDLSNGYPDRTG